MRPDRSGPRRAPLPLLPSVVWVVLSSLRLGKVAVLVVLVLAYALVELVRFAGAADRWPDTKRPLLAGAALVGLALGSELGFGFGGGRGLMLWAATMWLAARAAALAGLIAWSAQSGARAPLYAWRRCQVVSLVLSVLWWLVLLAAGEVTDPAVSAVSVHGIRVQLPGGVAMLLAFVALSLFGEGALQLRAMRETAAWLAQAPGVGPRSGRPPTRTPVPTVATSPAPAPTPVLPSMAPRSTPSRAAPPEAQVDWPVGDDDGAIGPVRPPAPIAFDDGE